MSYEIGRDLERLRHELDELCRRHDAHVSDGHSSEVGEHQHELAPEEVEEILVAAAEAVKELVEEVPKEAKAEVEEAAEALEEAAEEVAEATESPEVDEDEPERVHPLYRKL